MQYTDEQIQKMLELKESIIDKMTKYQEELDFLKKNLEIMDIVLKSSSFTKASSLPRKKEEKPVIEITEPGDRNIVFGKITVNGNASDPDEGDSIEKIEIRIGNGDWEDVGISNKLSSTSWKYVIDTTLYENDDYTIYARAYDGEFYSNIEKIILEFENYVNFAPEIKYLNANENSFFTGDEITLSGEIEDKNGNDDIIEISIDIFILENNIPKKIESFGMSKMVFNNIGNYKIYIEKTITLEKYEPGSYNVVLTIGDSESEQDSNTYNFIVVESESIKTEDDFNFFWIGSPIAILIVGIIGLIAYKKKKEVEYESEECPVCGNDMEYVKKYDDYYCYGCEEYFEDMDD